MVDLPGRQRQASKDRRGPDVVHWGKGRHTLLALASAVALKLSPSREGGRSARAFLDKMSEQAPVSLVRYSIDLMEIYIQPVCISSASSTLSSRVRSNVIGHLGQAPDLLGRSI